MTSGPRCLPTQASFHSPRAFTRVGRPALLPPWRRRPPPPGPSKKATDRQLAPDPQPAVQRAGRSTGALGATGGDSLPDRVRPSARFYAQSPTRTGEQDTTTLLQNVPGRGTRTRRAGGERRGGRRILNSPPTGQGNALPSEGDRRSTLGGASTCAENYLALTPVPVTTFQHTRRNPFCDPDDGSFGKSNVQQQDK